MVKLKNIFTKYIFPALIGIFIIGWLINDQQIVTNEYGYIGADRYGRQVFINSMNELLKDSGTIMESEANDSNFFGNIIFGEPMITTLKIRYLTVEAPQQEVDEKTLRTLLSDSAEEILNIIGASPDITLTRSNSITGRTLIKRAKRYDIKTIEDLLVSFGFKKYEMYLNSELVASVNLNNKGNTVLHEKGIIEWSKTGYMPPKKQEDTDYLEKHGSLPPDYE